jgi:hypothetical protein
VNLHEEDLSRQLDDYIDQNRRLREENAQMVIKINTYRADIERLHREAHARQVMIDELRKGYGY